MKTAIVTAITTLTLLTTALAGVPAASAIDLKANYCLVRVCDNVPAPQVPQINKVCFYIGEDYSDRFFCETGSRTVRTIREAWKHKIKSIEVFGGGSVWICNEADRQGDCQHIDHSVRELSPDLFKNLQSYRTQAI